MSTPNPLPYHLREGAPQRRVVCAALQYGPMMVVGPRHYDPIMRAHIALYKASMKHPELSEQRWPMALQGFVDQWGTFMTREEALEVARAAGQIMRRVGGDETQLFSENLY